MGTRRLKKMWSVTFTPAQAAAIEAIAEERTVPLTVVIRWAVDDYLKARRAQGYAANGAEVPERVAVVG